MLYIYKASAGSGKTYTLTLEYIKLLLGYRDEEGHYRIYHKSDSAHRRILAVTFTNKATEEMKHRIVSQLDLLAHDTDRSPYIGELERLFGCGREQVQATAAETLYVLLHDFSYFNISTIDRFFQQVLRNFTREVGLQGSFEVEMDNDFVTASAIDRMYSDLSDDDQKGAAQLVGTLCRGAHRVGQLVEPGEPQRTQGRLARAGRGSCRRRTTNCTVHRYSPKSRIRRCSTATCGRCAG